ncbi:DNA repair protein RadA [candidate division KSB1 bacterium]|nr:DNA repair protein RadA [candidate division KSB1 bacterium]
MNRKKSKQRTHYVCQHCGTISPGYMGKCPGCNAWNSLVEEKIKPAGNTGTISKGPGSEAVPLHEITMDQLPRYSASSAEFNRVLGGGIVKGSVVLIGGDPGIGKSTLLLQEATQINHKILYVTGEESLQQTKMRAVRLQLNSENLYIYAETELEDIVETIHKLKPQFVVVDSIQTIFTAALESAPGSVSQVRECAMRFIQIAKSMHIPIFLIGHVTKEGYLAGPKVLEHMVDALLLFEGDRDHFYRILRSIKNRFGSTREIGVFEMTEKGLEDVINPSAVFLAERQTDTSGSTVVCSMEGTRPILIEIQALVSSSNYGLPQRNTIGLDQRRIMMLLAVLEKRLSFKIGSMDVFVNAVGGMRIDETAADLGVLASIASSMHNRVIDPEAILLGEIGLGGELRSITHMESRISEATKMGFKKAVLPKGNRKKLSVSDIELIPVNNAQSALDIVLQ